MVASEIVAELQKRATGPLEFIAENAAALVFLCVAVASAERASAGGAEFANRFALAFFSIGAVQTVARMVTEEPGAAVLPQLCMSRHPLWRLAAARDAAAAALFVPVMAAMLAACKAITGVHIPLPPARALLPIALMRLGMLGVGFAVGAVALLNRGIVPLINLASMGLLATALVPASRLSDSIAAMLFPFTAWLGPISAACGAPSAGALPAWRAGTAVAVSAAYLACGVSLFNAAFRRALVTGSLARW